MSADTPPALKSPTPYEEQVQLLRSGGLLTPDTEAASAAVASRPEMRSQ